VVVVDHLGIPDLIELPRHGLGLDLREHRPVSVVVVADVVVIELRRRRRLEGCAEVLHVPIAHDVEAVGIHRGHQQQDGVVAHATRFVVLRGDQPPAKLRRVLRARHFGGVQTAVDPHDGLAFFRQRPRLWLVHPAGYGELPRDLLVTCPVLDVGLARDRRQDHRPPLGAPADLLDHVAIRGGVELAEVIDDLLVAGELVVVPRPEAEYVPGLWHARAGNLRGRSGTALREKSGGRDGEGCGQNEVDERTARRHGHGALPTWWNSNFTAKVAGGAGGLQ
jgi:hypothetical protein